MMLRTCVVSYQDLNCKYSVEVVAETLHEAAVLGIKAMNVPRDKLHFLTLEVLIKAPEVYRSISGAALIAWLAHPGKNQKEEALKLRLKELMQECSSRS
jgi:hypothetical protein